MRKTLKVLIDGKPNTLTLVGVPDGRNNDCYRYNTEGNCSQHTFKFPLAPGQKRRTSGSFYEILKEEDQ